MPVIYIDIFFIENFIIDFLLILCSVKISPSFAKKSRIVFASLIAAAYSVAAVFCLKILNNPITGVAVSFVIVYIAFLPQDIRNFVKSMAYFYAVCFIFGGFVNVLIYMTDFARIFGGVFFDGAVYLPFSTFKIVLFTVLCWLIVTKTADVIKRALQHSCSMRRVCVKCCGKSFESSGFIDTGNMLFERSSHLPVTVMDKSCIAKLFDERLCRFILSKDIASIYEFYGDLKWFIIPYSTVSGKSLMLAFMPESVIISNNTEKKCITECLIGISEKKLSADGCKFIINPNSLKKG